MNDFTKSSALVSSTSSISPRIASMSSSSCSLRSDTSLCDAPSVCSWVSEDFFGCFCSCAMRSSSMQVTVKTRNDVAPTARVGATCHSRPYRLKGQHARQWVRVDLPGQRGKKLLGCLAPVEKLAYVGAAAAH